MATIKTALSALQKTYPLELAERLWDNVGLLVDSASDKPLTKVLLAVDLTRAVCTEAIQKKSNLIIAYHPFIFRGLKQVGLTLDPQQVSLIELIKNDISVYSPHTAVDAVKGGVNDWLVGTIVDHKLEQVSSLVPIQNADENGNGMGRLAELKEAFSLDTIVDNIKKNLGVPHIQLARGVGSKDIKTVGVCAGSGGGVFADFLKNGNLPDLLYTGELSHHEILAFKERGASVVVCNHSNTERGYLKVMKDKLAKELGGVEIEISGEDADPLVVV